jgi:hypothetical protein
MTPTLLLAISIGVAFLVLIWAVRLVSRYAHAGKTFDLGVVSTRWLSELRRDEPWTRS